MIKKILYGVFWGLFLGYVNAAGAQEHLINVKRQPIQVSDVQQGLQLASNYLSLLQQNKIEEAVWTYHYFSEEALKNSDAIIENFKQTYGRLEQQLGSISNFRYQEYGLGEVKTWIPGQQNPGLLLCYFKIRYEKAEARMIVNIIRYGDILKVRDVAFQDITPVP